MHWKQKSVVWCVCGVTSIRLDPLTVTQEGDWFCFQLIKPSQIFIVVLLEARHLCVCVVICRITFFMPKIRLLCVKSEIGARKHFNILQIELTCESTVLFSSVPLMWIHGLLAEQTAIGCQSWCKQVRLWEHWMGIVSNSCVNSDTAVNQMWRNEAQCMGTLTYGSSFLAVRSPSWRTLVIHTVCCTCDECDDSLCGNTDRTFSDVSLLFKVFLWSSGIVNTD